MLRGSKQDHAAIGCEEWCHLGSAESSSCPEPVNKTGGTMRLCKDEPNNQQPPPAPHPIHCSDILDVLHRVLQPLPVLSSMACFEAS